MQSVTTSEHVKEVEEEERVASPNQDCGGFGKMTLFVRSKRAVVLDKIVTVPSFSSLLGPVVRHQERICTYGDVFDREQLEVIQHCKTLVTNLGISLEVKDISKSNVVARFFRFLAHGGSQAAPSVSLNGDALISLMREEQVRLIRR